MRRLSRWLLWMVAVYMVLAIDRGPVTAQSLYHWIDAQGVVHYSQFPPPSNAALASPVDIPRGQPSPPILPTDSPTSGARIVTASGEYRMGERDTREEAIRLATEAAKRNALEEVATYLEGVTVVSEAKVTKDEIRTYTAGVILVLDKKVSTRLEGNTVVIHVDLTAQVDPEEVVQAIKALRDNQQAATQIAALQGEVVRLHAELDAANRWLAAAAGANETRAISQQRRDLLNRIESDGLLSQAWTDWVIVTPATTTRPGIGLGQVYALFAQARSLSPANPYLGTLQQLVASQGIPVPPLMSVNLPVRSWPPAAAPYATRPPTPSAPSSSPAYVPPSIPLPPTLYQLHSSPRPIPRVPYRTWSPRSGPVRERGLWARPGR